MTTTVETPSGQALTPLSAAVDSLLAADLGRLSRDELLDALRGLECESRRLAAVGHRVVAEVTGRNVAGELRYRVAAVRDPAVDPRPGQRPGQRRRGPRTPDLAARPAAAGGAARDRAGADRRRDLSGAHRRDPGLTPLPAPVRDEHQATAEALLAEHAATMDP